MARLSLDTARRAGLGRSPLATPILVRNDHCEFAGGLSAILATSDLDIGSLDPARMAAAAAAFARLCHTLESPLQLLVRVRAVVAPETAPGEGPYTKLDAAMRQYWAEQLSDGGRHGRRVFVALRAQTPAALDLACSHASDRLAALGITALRLRGDALFELVAGGLDSNPEVAWYEHPQYATVGHILVRGHALRRLPGHPVGPGWLAPLLGVQTECDIAIHLTPAPLGDALGRLSRRLRDFSAHRMLEVERGALSDVHVDIGLDSATALRERLARNLGRPLHLSLVATVRGSTLEEVAARSDVLRLGFASALVGMEVTHFRHMAALVSTLPLCVNALGAAKLVELDGGVDVRPVDRGRLLRSGRLPARCGGPIGTAGEGGAIRHRAPSQPQHRGLRGVRPR